MEHQPQSKNHFTMMYGLYLGISLVISTVIFYVAGNPFSEFLGYLTFALMIGILSWAMKTYAASQEEMGMSYGEGVGIGVMICLYASIITAFFSYVLYKFIDPSLTEKLIAATEETLLAQGRSEEQVEQLISVSSKFMTPGLQAVSQVLALLLYGTVISLVLSIIFKKKPENKDPFAGVEDEYDEQ